MSNLTLDNDGFAYLIPDYIFPDALRHLASYYNIIIDERQPEIKRDPGWQSKSRKKSFCQIQLVESGLKPEDVTAKVFENDIEKTSKETVVFRSGTRSQYGELTSGDDMIIFYYDLDGRPVKYQKPNSQKYELLYRVRWQNPSLHKDKEGKAIKYASPKGSGSHLYFPQAIRDHYRQKKAIPRLFIQEGEKKAEKATKHGIPSVGIMGIHNLGQKGKIPEEMQLLIKDCEIKEVVFILDSDWNHISTNIKPSIPVDLRPKTFFTAIRNYRDYFKSLINHDINIEIYFGYIQENENKDKGIDDLLVKTLNRKESELKEDFEFAVNEKSGTGKYVQLHKITTMTDFQIREFWKLHDPEQFAKQYFSILKEFPEFIIGRHKWRFIEGRFESAQPIEEAETFWQYKSYVDKRGNEQKTPHFDYANCYTFLHNRGYGRIMMANGEFKLAHKNGFIVTQVDSYVVKDFVMDFTKVIAPKDILNMMYRGAKMYLGPDSLSNLEFMYPEFETASRDHQMLYFKSCAWKITSQEIKEIPFTSLKQYVWREKVNKFEAKISKKSLVKIYQEDGRFDVELSSEGKKCHFLNFILNASNFFHRKPKSEITSDEAYETAQHFLSKMTAIGYLLHSYKDYSRTKAIIAMDGKLSEIGSSHGRSGKSLLGLAIEHVVPLAYIGSKSKKITEDQFLFEEVTEKTEVIFLDDVRANIDFEFFFPIITGKLTVNPKGGKKFTLPSDQTPKLLLSTNHAINGEGGSFRDRQFPVAFSDYYNENHKPTDDFVQVFFEEWETDQWNGFYNFIAECILAYLRFGFIKAPDERLELRRLRQVMGEVFLGWAEEYYAFYGEFDPTTGGWPGETNMGRRIAKKEIWDAYIEANPRERAYTPVTKFKKKLKAYAQYKGFAFNPAKEGKDDKANGIEYITLDK